MDAFERLSDEHRLIGKVLDAFEQYVARIEGGHPVERADLERFVAFFRAYVDLHHHEKEESILSPALARNGFHWDEGALHAMRREHDHERYLARSLRHAALQSSGWSVEERRHLVAVARELIAFLRAHIDHEERLLFPEARRRLSAPVTAQILSDFERFDAGRPSDSTPAKLGELARALCYTWLRAG